MFWSSTLVESYLHLSQLHILLSHALELVDYFLLAIFTYFSFFFFVFFLIKFLILYKNYFPNTSISTGNIVDVYSFKLPLNSMLFLYCILLRWAYFLTYWVHLPNRGQSSYHSKALYLVKKIFIYLFIFLLNMSVLPNFSCSTYIAFIISIQLIIKNVSYQSVVFVNVLQSI